MKNKLARMLSPINNTLFSLLLVLAGVLFLVGCADTGNDSGGGTDHSQHSHH